MGLCIAAVMGLSAVAVAQTPPAERRQERREDRQERREDRKEAREDKQERREDKQEAREDRKDAREDKLEEMRKTRTERRQARLKELRDRWGEVANRPPVREELRNHARRMARLTRAKHVAIGANKTEIAARIDKLIEREKARHQAQMDKFRAEAGKPEAGKPEAGKTEAPK
jgi:hypothetical protein